MIIKITYPNLLHGCNFLCFISMNINEFEKYLSRVLWPLQPVQSNFHPLMTMAESNEPTTSSLCHKDFKSCSQAQDLHDELTSSYGSQGRPGS